MFNNLIYGDSRSFYKKKMTYLHKSVHIPNHRDIDKFSQLIKKINRFCVCIGLSELLSPFGLYLSDKLEKHKKNKDAIRKTIKDVGFAISSMEERYWKPILNQEIIIDTLLDKPTVNDEAWGITNAMVGLVMKEPIHYIKKGKYYLDLDKAFHLVKCRVTRDELCLIYTILYKEKQNYVIKCVKLTSDFRVYLIYMKN